MRIYAIYLLIQEDATVHESLKPYRKPVLVIPALNPSLAKLTPIAAIGIATVMIVYCGLHLATGNAFNGQPIYWLVVAAVCAFATYGRFVLSPLG